VGIASVVVVWMVLKRREIGILRTMGASRGRVQRIFLLQGAIVAIAGSLLGSVLATGMIAAFTRVVRSADGTPLFDAIAMPAWLYAAAVGGAIAGGIVAALLPARAAARLDPAQAIRM
jgi:lipoprotein-releasing system permease protein